MQQIHELDKQLRKANGTIESKMRALDEQGLTAVNLSGKLKEKTRELKAALAEIEELKRRERVLESKEREALQSVCIRLSAYSILMSSLQANETETETSRIKRELQRLQTRLSDAKDERDEAVRKVQHLESQLRMVSRILKLLYLVLIDFRTSWSVINGGQVCFSVYAFLI